jgi:hypothetical protein
MLRTSITTLAVVLLSVSQAGAETPEERIDRLARKLEANNARVTDQLRAELKKLEATLGEVRAEIDKAKKGTIDRRVKTKTERNGKLVFPSLAARADAVKLAQEQTASAEAKHAEAMPRLQARLAAAESGEKPYLPRLPDGFQVGDFGGIRIIEVVQVIDDQNLVAKVSGELAWVSGVPTRRLSDGTQADAGERLFEVTGNKSYRTATGTQRTVLLLECVESEPILAKVRERAGK